MLQISRRADYAVRIMLELGLQDSDTRLSAAKLAERADVTKAFVHKITADLAKHGLLVIYKGPSGGIMLARPQSEISMLDILEAVEGPVCLNTCLLRPAECHRDTTCPAHTFWGRLQSIVVSELRAAALDTLVKQAKLLEDGQKHNITIPYILDQST